MIRLGDQGRRTCKNSRLGRGTNQHALIAGRTGSGKSTLPHVLVTNAALWYPPEELSLYLVDFKKGVEFKTYASRDLPHAKAVAVESDREFGLSVLERIDEELVERGEIFRRLGVQNLPGYRSLPDQPAMLCILLVIDEFQELFVEDDKLAQDASLLLDRIVRQVPSASMPSWGPRLGWRTPWPAAPWGKCKSEWPCSALNPIRI